MEKTLKNLASVSLFFLVITGGAHLSASFLLIQGNQSELLMILAQSLDLPFLLSALLYGSARFSLALEEATGKGKIALILCSIFSLLMLSTALFVNFAFPDVQLLG